MQGFEFIRKTVKISFLQPLPNQKKASLGQSFVRNKRLKIQDFGANLC